MQLATIIKLAHAFGLTYCHPRYCSCGNDSYLLWLEVTWQEEHALLPSWANGVEPTDLYNWIQEQSWHNAAIRDALKKVGLNQYQRFQ
jgi:hypothetical protein